MTRLAAPVSATDTELEVDGPLTAALPYRIIIDEEPMMVTGVSGMRWVVRRGIAGDPVDHDADTVIERAYGLYGTAPNAGLSAGGAHPSLASHESLGLAADDHSHPAPDLTHDHDGTYASVHTHPYAADDHTHPGGGEHPDLAAHETLGLSAEVHTHDEYATDSDLTTHAGTAHGLSAHAIDGAYHTGAEVLPTQGQKNALSGTSGTPGVTNQYVTHQDARLSDERTPTAHTHDYAATDHGHTLADGDIPAAIARDAEVTSAIATHASTPHGGDSSEVYAVGDLYLTTTNHADAAAVTTRHGYGTWARFGVGRFLLLTDGTAGTEGGSATHAHAFTQPDAHTDVPTHTHTTDSQGAHVHDEYNNSATTGPNVGWGAQDTSTNTASLTGYDTGSAGAHTHTAAAPAGAVASQPHSGGVVTDGSTDPLSITAYAWQRTA